ncbi:MAG: hypothetical protein HY914_10105 [Desulfomonile tiedjei]|nr:hypothetical protein [Desulfomonile tiedjei]
MSFGGFSWKRALGISALKSRISRSTGIPWTRSGRQRKLGAMMTGGWRAGGRGSGCLLPIVAGVMIAGIFLAFALH